MTGINIMRLWIIASLLLFGSYAYSEKLIQDPPNKPPLAGKVLLAVGEVYSLRGDKKVALKRRSKIYEHDEIHVEANAKAQIRMVDSAIISLQENSVFRINSYRYHKDNKKDQGNSAFLELLSGGLRTISGKIGKSNKKAYKLDTPLATIGIRGTDYQIAFVDGDLYFGVWEGAINVHSLVTNDSDIQIGSDYPFSFLFMDKQGVTTKLDAAPAVFAKGKKKSSTTSSTDSSSEAVELPDPVVSTDNNSKQALLVNQTESDKVISANPTMVGDAPVLFDTDNAQISANSATTDFAQSIGGYDVSWGQWSSTTSSTNDRNTANEDNMLWTVYETSPMDSVSTKTGTVQYNQVVDSIMGSSQGNVTNLGVDMNVDFDSGNVSNGVLSANTNSDTWVGLFDGQIQNGDLELQMTDASVISANPSTIGSIRDATGSISGDFIGDQAEGVVGAFEISEDNTTNHIEGIFVVEPGTP